MADPMTRDAMIAAVDSMMAHGSCAALLLENGDEGVAEELKALNERGHEVIAALRAAPPADRRINTRCPSCGSATLFLDDHGHLACSLIGCKEPVVERAVAVLKAAPPADAGAPPCIGHDPLCPCQDGDSCHYRDTADTRAMQRPDAGAPPALVALDENDDDALFIAGAVTGESGGLPTRKRALGTPAPPAAPPAVQVGEPMPEIQVGDWARESVTSHRPFLVEAGYALDWCNANRGDLVELRGERNGQPFIWRRREGA